MTFAGSRGQGFGDWRQRGDGCSDTLFMSVMNVQHLVDPWIRLQMVGYDAEETDSLFWAFEDVWRRLAATRNEANLDAGSNATQLRSCIPGAQGRGK